MTKKKENSNILDPKVKKWVENYDLKINKEEIFNLTNAVAEDTCKKIVQSVCKKVGVLSGISLANNILKYELGMEDMEVSSEVFLKTIKELSDLESKSIAIGYSEFSEENKKKLLEICLNAFESPEKPKNKNVADIFKEHLKEFYLNNGEYPNPDFNKVEMVKDKIAARPPFGRKNKK